MKALEWIRLYVSVRKAEVRGYAYDGREQLLKHWTQCSPHDQAKLRVIQRLIEELDLRGNQ